MKKKLFFFGDSHGYYDETIECLKESGYDENNKDHLLVCLGDMTDRGSQSKELLEWLYRLDKENKAIVLGGNHSKFLIDYLSGGSYSPFNYLNNGVNETFASLLERTRPFESWCLIDENIKEPTNGDFVRWLDIAIKEINKKYPWLLSWLISLPKYFESKNYIGVHGAIDTEVEDWHYPKKELYSLKDWEALDFNDGTFFTKNIENTNGKTVVVGHFYTYILRNVYLGETSDYREANHDILDINDENGHKIFIDGCTPYTKKVNVLVIEDELLEEDDGNKRTI